MKHAWLLLLALLVSPAYAGIGNVSDLQGTALQVKRGSSVSPGALKTAINQNDTVITGSNTITGIKFEDDTKVRITANSRLVIDEFVYDGSKSDAGRLAMKVALGTVRYASGQIAKKSHQNVAIRTPTATIGVRGTDFSMTVDETGRSLVVLLPSCDDEKKLRNFEIFGNCVTGQIDVITDAGIVTLTKPFTATMVASASQEPGRVIQLLPDVAAISNEILVATPDAVDAWVAENEQKQEERRSPGAVASAEAKNKVTADSNDKAVKESSEKVAKEVTKDESKAALIKVVPELAVAKPKQETATTTAASTAKEEPVNLCGIFTACGNERGVNWYERLDPLRGDYVRIRSNEKTDNTVYNVSQNVRDMPTMIVNPGSGLNIVTIRQTNQ